jgi:acyl-CoA thioesterase-1
MRLPAGLLFLFASAAGAWGQGSAELSIPDVNQMCTRLTQLMEAGGFAIPALTRAAEPVIASLKQSCVQLQIRPGAGEPTYGLLLNIRAYLSLADAVPKPFPLPEPARKQLEEVREASLRLDAHFRALLDSKDASLRAPDRDNVTRFQEENRLVGPPTADRRRVVFLGDSITALWRLNEYFPQEDFINRSIEGQITGQLLGRMKVDVVDLRPAAVVVQGGSFDLARGIPLKAIQDNYVALSDLAAANNIKLLFTSVLPVTDAHKDENPAYERTPTRPPIYIRALNDWLKALCAQRGCAYVDYYSVLADQQGALLVDVSDDGLLPNAKGYRLMAPVLAEAVGEATRPSAPPPPPQSTKPTRRR